MKQVGKVIVTESEKGGSLYITSKDGVVSASIVVMQDRYQLIRRKGILTQTRYAELVDDISRMVSLNLRPGDQLPGNIVIKTQFSPVDTINEELYKLKDLQGEEITDEFGRQVWLKSYYTEDPLDEDDCVIAL